MFDKLLFFCILVNMQVAKTKQKKSGYQYLNVKLSDQEYAQFRKQMIDEGGTVADRVGDLIRSYLTRAGRDRLVTPASD